MTAPHAGAVGIDPLAGAETGPVIRSTAVGVLDRVVAVLDAVETRRMTASELAAPWVCPCPPHTGWSGR